MAAGAGGKASPDDAGAGWDAVAVRSVSSDPGGGGSEWIAFPLDPRERAGMPNTAEDTDGGAGTGASTGAPGGAGRGAHAATNGQDEVESAMEESRVGMAGRGATTGGDTTLGQRGRLALGGPPKTEK